MRTTRITINCNETLSLRTFPKELRMGSIKEAAFLKEGSLFA